jgi:hypothetical protein
LAIAGMGAALSSGSGPLLVAAGRPLVLLQFNVFSLVTYGAMIYLVAPLGLHTVCASVAAYSILSTFALYMVMSRLLAISVRSFVVETLPGLVSTAALAAAAWPVVHELGGRPALVTLAAGTIVGLTAYTLVLRYVFLSAFRDLAAVGRRLAPAGVRARRAERARSVAPTPPPA